VAKLNMETVRFAAVT